MNLEQAKKDIDRAGDEFHQHGELGIEKTTLLFRVAMDAVAELERVYTTMDRFPPLIVVSPKLLLKKFGNTWGVFHNGKAVGGHDTIREALARAWELEASHE